MLKDKQPKVLQKLYQGNDTFTWLPTGFGKSICYRVMYFVFAYELKCVGVPALEQSIVVIIYLLLSLIIAHVSSL